MSFNNTAILKQFASVIRSKVVQLSHQGRTPHLGSSLSCVDIMSVLYSKYLNISSDNPEDPDRDYFFLSKGHAVTTLYGILAKLGFFEEQELMETYAVTGSRFPEHPSRFCVPGVEASSGSLGHGLGLGVGVALSQKIQKRNSKTYVLLSDGECNEGSIWEAAMTAPKLGLNNLCAIVDFNKWQATGRSPEVLSLEPLEDKFRSFGWQVDRIDGHDLNAISQCYSKFVNKQNGPYVIIADTVKGKGVDFMEDDNNWHYRIPNSDEVKEAFKQLGIY